MTLVEKLVRCSSVSGGEKEAVSLLCREMSSRGFRSYQDEIGNAIGVIGNGKQTVSLVGHIDTVSGDIPVRFEDGILYGRGSVDAKGPLAAFVEAAAHFFESQLITVLVVGCVREETDSAGGKHLLTDLSTPDWAVIGEPSGWNGVTIGYKGSFTLEYRLEVPRHHYGAADKTAAEEAVTFYDALCRAYPETGPQFGAVSIRLTKMKTSSLGTHEVAEMEINVRTPVEFDIEGFDATVVDLSNRASILIKGFVPAVVGDKRNPLVRSFLGAVRSRNGTPCFKYKTGTSDMNHLAYGHEEYPAWSCPMVAYGPGDSSLDHTPDEHLRIEEYEKSIAVLVAMLGRLENHAKVM